MKCICQILALQQGLCVNVERKDQQLLWLIESPIAFFVNTGEDAIHGYKSNVCYSCAFFTQHDAMLSMKIGTMDLVITIVNGDLPDLMIEIQPTEHDIHLYISSSDSFLAGMMYGTIYVAAPASFLSDGQYKMYLESDPHREVIFEQIRSKIHLTYKKDV